MEERLAEEEDEDLDEDEDQVKSFKSAKKGPASKKRNMRRDSDEESEEESDLDEDIDDEPKKPPPKKMQKINNAPVHPYKKDDEDDDDGAVNPFQPVAPTPLKLPPVNKLGGQAGKPVNYDFSNPFGGPQGQLPPIGRQPGGGYP
jgi:hypothetical protein